MCDLLAVKYALSTKQTEISNRLNALKRDEAKKKDDDNYAILGKLTKRINELAPMACEIDRKDEAKVRFVTKTVIGTPRGLSALQRTT